MAMLPADYTVAPERTVVPRKLAKVMNQTYVGWAILNRKAFPGGMVQTTKIRLTDRNTRSRPASV